MSECQRCKELEAEVQALKHRIVALNRIISDMSGPATLEMDSPYEDENKPEWMWRLEEKE